MKDPCGDGMFCSLTVNISMLVVVMLYDSFQRCYHWGKLGEGYVICEISLIFLTTACEPTIISK